MSSHELVQALTELYARFRFNRLALVAHSMGGLVSRAAIQEIEGSLPQLPLRLFVSISTPWEGLSIAKMGADYSPAVVPAWLDVVPDSPFLEKLLQKPLPPSMAFHLFFGVEGGAGPTAPCRFPVKYR